MVQRRAASAESGAPHVGSGIRAPGGVWTFGGDTPGAFDEHIVRSVPAYHECHDLILAVASEVVPAGGRCYDLGCSTGTLAARLAERLRPRSVDVIGVDRQPEMIALARRRFAGEQSLRFVTAALEQFTFAPADLVVCFYTLQFVALRQRQAVLERIRRALSPHGALILFEKIVASCAKGHAVAEQAYFDFKRRNGFTNDEIVLKNQSLRGVLQPVRAEDNYGMLQRAGFCEVTQLFRWLLFDGVVAYASPDAAR